MRRVLVLVVGVLLAGCGSDDKPRRAGSPATQTTQAATAQDISLQPFVSNLRLSLAAVDEFMGAFASCLDTQGCAREERAEALSKIDATTYAADNIADAAADPCGTVFTEVVEGLRRQRRAVIALQDSAGDATGVEAATDRVNRSTDLLAGTVDDVRADC